MEIPDDCIPIRLLQQAIPAVHIDRTTAPVSSVAVLYVPRLCLDSTSPAATRPGIAFLLVRIGGFWLVSSQLELSGPNAMRLITTATLLAAVSGAAYADADGGPSSSVSAEVAAIRSFFYAGGGYASDGAGGHVFREQMYVERLQPTKGVTQPNPIVFIHGQAQTGTVSPFTFIFPCMAYTSLGLRSTYMRAVYIVAIPKPPADKIKYADQAVAYLLPIYLRINPTEIPTR